MSDDLPDGERRKCLTVQEWFPTSGYNTTTLAQALSCDVSTINELLRGRRWPSLLLAAKLYRLTAGVVSRWDAPFHEANQRIPASRVTQSRGPARPRAAANG